MGNTSKRYSAEVRARAVRMASEHRDQYGSQWAAIVGHVLPPVAGTTEFLLQFADVTLASRADVLEAAEYLQQGFGLYFSEHQIHARPVAAT